MYFEGILETLVPEKEQKRTEKTDKFFSTLMLSCVSRISHAMSLHVNQHN